jgi:hypothetical protein
MIGAQVSTIGAEFCVCGRYGGYITSSRMKTVQFTPAHNKESRVQKIEVKIRLPGRAIQNTEIEDRVSSLCVVKL